MVYTLTPIAQALGLKILLRCSMTEFHKDLLLGEDTTASSAVVPSVTLGYLTGGRHEKALHGMRDQRLGKVEQTTPKLRAAPLIEQGRSIFGGDVSATVIGNRVIGTYVGRKQGDHGDGGVCHPRVATTTCGKL